MNTLKTALLLTALTLLLVIVGGYFGGRNGMVLALVVAAGMNFFSYFYSDKLALAMYRAQPVTREQLPRAYQVVERMTQRVGLPMPKIMSSPRSRRMPLPRGAIRSMPRSPLPKASSIF